MITAMNHVSFTVSNLERSVAFYRDAIGLEYVNAFQRDEAFSARVTGIAGASLKIAYLRTSNCSIELIEYLTPEGRKIDTATCNVGSAHVCFNVDDFDASVDRVLSMGGSLAGERVVVPSGGNQGRSVAYLEDPDGNTIEFISNAA